MVIKLAGKTELDRERLLKKNPEGSWVWKCVSLKEQYVITKWGRYEQR